MSMRNGALRVPAPGSQSIEGRVEVDKKNGKIITMLHAISFDDWASS